MKPRIIDGLRVVEAEPGAPPPPGVPSWAERCELLETPNCPPALRPWVIAAGVLGTVGCAVAIGWFGQWGGIAPLPLSLAVLWYGLWSGTSRRLEPSATGRYLAFDEGTGSEQGAAEWAGRITVFFIGALIVFGVVRSLFSEERDWLAASSLGMFGLGLLYFAVTRKLPFDDEPGLGRASLRFRALADPTRPLTADDPVAAPRGEIAPADSPAGDSRPTASGATGED